ncbi:LysR family transcriptional regulator [Bradyrhizobium sp. Arg237L]|uniref:LysR family transcriptional regulator n=1 Tax=Bradyrhizobium sp. Arg237L TaxID=3003352 RepID=UPI00249E6FA9|nr:LysR family transcriptional regulator [Bradyrhizobium sp. Arg237L]MDI4234173.1 LysR family transcriptional regulator [Bradyrhizobium sp. Arg237L]
MLNDPKWAAQSTLKIDGAKRSFGVGQLVGRGAPVSRMSLDLLMHFEVLMRERHVTRAAVAIGIGQSAMSSALGKLRDAFKDPLLVRTNRGLVPTARALELEQLVREMLRIANELHSSQVNSVEPRDMEATLNLAAFDGAIHAFLPPLMAHLRAAAPKLQIRVEQVDNRRVGEMLESGDCDISLDIISSPPQQLRCVNLLPQRIMCIASQGHPEIKGGLTLEQFVKYPHVLWGSPSVPFPVIESYVESALRREGLGRSPGVRVPSATMAASIVAETDMIACICDHLADEGMEILPIQVLAPPIRLNEVDIRMYWHERTHHDPVRSYVRKSLQSIAKGLRTEFEKRRIGAAGIRGHQYSEFRSPVSAI